MNKTSEKPVVQKVPKEVDKLGFTSDEIEGSSLLVIGEGGDAIIAAFLAHSARVEHLVFSASQVESLKCKYPDHKIHLGDASAPLSKLPKGRFRFVALFGEYPAKISDHLLLLVMDTCGEAFIIEDPYANDPGTRYEIPWSQGWVTQRYSFLKRQVQTYRLSDIRVIESMEHPIYLCRKGPLKPLLVFVHTPKCGGLTVVDTIYKSFGHAGTHISLFAPPWASGELGGIHAFLAMFTELDAVASHLFRYSFPSVLADRAMLYLTIIRDPLKQLQSLVRYLKYNYTLIDGWRASTMPEFQPSMRLTEIADACIKDPDRFKNILPSRFITDARSADQVIRILQRFTCVGVLERYKDSMWLAEKKFAEYGLPFKYEKGIRKNASLGESISGQAIPVDHAEQEEELRNYQPLIDFVQNEAAMDIEIHRWATEHFDKEFKRMKAKLGEA